MNYCGSPHGIAGNCLLFHYNIHYQMCIIVLCWSQCCSAWLNLEGNDQFGVRVAGGKDLFLQEVQGSVGFKGIFAVFSLN